MGMTYSCCTGNSLKGHEQGCKNNQTVRTTMYGPKPAHYRPKCLACLAMPNMEHAPNCPIRLGSTTAKPGALVARPITVFIPGLAVTPPDPTNALSVGLTQPMNLTAPVNNQKCGECRALVESEDMMFHTEWHNDEKRRWEEAQRRLTPKIKTAPKQGDHEVAVHVDPAGDGKKFYTIADTTSVRREDMIDAGEVRAAIQNAVENQTRNAAAFIEFPAEYPDDQGSSVFSAYDFETSKGQQIRARRADMMGMPVISDTSIPHGHIIIKNTGA